MKNTITRIEVERSGEKPDLKVFAHYMLPLARAFFQDPENEKKFLEWKAARERGEVKQ